MRERIHEPASRARTSGAVAEGLGDALGRPAQPLAALVLAQPREQRAHRRLDGVALPGEQLEVVVLLLLARGGEVGVLERSHGGAALHCSRRLSLDKEKRGNEEEERRLGVSGWIDTF
jgi:hypothetical protein